MTLQVWSLWFAYANGRVDFPPALEKSNRAKWTVCEADLRLFAGC